MSISDQIRTIREALPGGVDLCAVSKTHPVEDILEAYRAGQRIFGENRVQELATKAVLCPPDIQWHFIGHLQSNKVRQAVCHASLIQSADRIDLIRAIDHEAALQNKQMDILLEFHIAQEASKHGFPLREDLVPALASLPGELRRTTIRGVMGMATFTPDQDLVRSEFQGLKRMFDLLKARIFLHQESFNVLSMGMSDDYLVAVSEGSSLVRIGSRIFGHRA